MSYDILLCDAFFNNINLTYVTLDHKTSHKGRFFKIEIIHHLKAEQISFPLMYGLLGSDNIWPRCNYLNIWNLRVQKKI